MKTRLFFLLLLVFFASAAIAVPFGVFDPRSLAMGGTGVASGTSANAAYYNPALLSMYKTRKEVGRNSRFIFPAVTARVSEAVIDNLDIEDENLEQDLVDAITAFNQTMTAQTAQGVLNAATDLNSRLDQLVDGPVNSDGNVGLILGIGHKQEGGSIIINRRWVGSAVAENSSSDLALLEDYVEAMQFIESGGTAGAPHPELFNPDGTLVDQTGNFASTGTGSGLELTEIGMAMSKEFQILGQRLAIGITPKIQSAILYDWNADATTGQSDTVKEEGEDWDLNLDIGLAQQINAQWRAGLVLKNVNSLRYTTSLGTEIKLDPQVRAGIAYDSPWGFYALDVDVIENDPVSYGSPSQMLSLGGEWKPKAWLQLRAGVTRNMQGIGNNRDPLFSAGFQWDFGGIFDLTYAQSASEVAFGLQFGYRF
ncbi:MAG TPA: conjugal transfer protein TraF [Gammaproteobacteria bacterium]